MCINSSRVRAVVELGLTSLRDETSGGRGALSPLAASDRFMASSIRSVSDSIGGSLLTWHERNIMSSLVSSSGESCIVILREQSPGINVAFFIVKQASKSGTIL
jgi:hypothetical protein